MDLTGGVEQEEIDVSIRNNASKEHAHTGKKKCKACQVAAKKDNIFSEKMRDTATWKREDQYWRH
jgi:hypothetical protein